MFVPVVRRKVTVTTRGVYDFPYQCDACGLHTTAHVQMEGVGSASALYVKADANAARSNAQHTAQVNAQYLLAQCPCPQCGAAARGSREALARYDESREAKLKRRSRVLLFGLIGAFVSSGGCVGLVVATSDDTGGVGGAIGAGVILSFFWFLLCAGGVGIAYAMMGPGKRPAPLTQRPQNVWFDPPQTQQQV